MDELIAFLNARLDEDEQAAADAAAILGDGDWWRRHTFVAYSEPNGTPEQVSHHIARHDPARVLADVAAKRAIVAACAYNLEYEEYGYTLAERVLRALALPYADHEDYKPHWRPRDV